MNHSERRTQQARWTVGVAATFVADPIRQPLEFWMETLNLPASIEIAPYAQVMQELLNPDSLFSQNDTGFNVLLVRPEDWIRDRLHENVERNRQHIERVASDLVAAVGVNRRKTRAPTLVYVCPPSASLSTVYGSVFAETQAVLVKRLSALENVRCFTHLDLIRLYPVPEYEDPRSDRIGHIPYTDDYFVALATLLARRIAVLVKPPYKVIAIDCDNTLWKGVCGEDGANGIELTPGHLELQKTLVRQHEAGMLLCLCSKNNPADVEAVFRAHPDMPLREEHLICSRVNWSPKSANLKSLSEELELSLDSFVFLDDSPMECAEVRAHCPSVLTLQIPQAQEQIAGFLDHVWVFDQTGATEEAKQRTEQYRQNRARKQAQAQATDLETFLASLELKIDLSPLQPDHLNRVAELVQRTNQFNLTTIRRRASEIEALLSAGALEAFVVHVRDRFGDYGLVGALLVHRTAESLEVDTFVLSCRVLGRGVEQRIVRELARKGRREGLRNLVLTYRQTARNAPAWEFLNKAFAQFREAHGGNGAGAIECRFTVPLEYAANLDRPATAPDAGMEEPRAHAVTPESLAPHTDWHDVAMRFSHVSDIAKEIRSARARRAGAPRVGAPDDAPGTPAEQAIAAIWSEVLGLHTVGLNDNFFDIGGDSLRAVRVVARIESVLGLELPLHAFFEGPTVAEIAARLPQAARPAAPIQRGDRTRPIPLSWSQQRLWFIDRLEGGSTAYHIPVVVRLRGILQRAALHAALDELVQRHEVLRTTFAEHDGEPVQVIAPTGRFALREVALDESRTGEIAVLEHSREELLTPFDLRSGPLVRGRLLKLSEREHVLLVTLHHMVGDGWSVGVFLRELAALYEAFRQKRSSPLEALPVQYADYALWQRQWLAGPRLDEQVAYWKAHLQGAPALLELPTDRPRPAVQTYRGACVPVALDVRLIDDLKALARGLDLTLPMVLYTAWAVLLARLSGQDDVVFGIPVANRRRTELEGLIGFLVNTLAIRVRLEDDPPATALLRRVKEVMLGAYAHQDAPFEQVVEALQPARSLSHSPVFQVMFALQNASSGALQLPGLTLAEEDVPLHTAQFDLLLSLRECGTGMAGSLNYATDLFDAATIERWAECFVCLLRGMVQAPERPVSRLPWMSAAQRRQVVELFNATQAPYPRDKLVPQLIEEQVQRTPDAPAVVFEGQSLTYAELNGRANQLARHLRSRGVGVDQLVGICVERSLEMVVGLLGILKAGAAYVPLDPSYPPERLRYMLGDAAPPVLLTQAHLAERLPAAAAEVIALDADWPAIARQAANDLDAGALGVEPHHLAYMIYTSGSTGLPKGAMNEHRAVVNRLHWMQMQYGLGADDRVLQKTPFSFDVSVWEFFWTLMSGACLVVARPQGHQDPAYLRGLIEATGVTTLHFVPSMLQIFLEGHQPGQCPSLRHVVCSGEELPASLQRRFFEHLPHARLSNLYGPTEAAIDVTYWECDPDDPGSRVPIGRPISNVQMYVLDRHAQPVPIGVTGEIYIGGVNVGRGYLNRPALTQERFIADPFGHEPGGRLYRTGDLGRWRADGAIEYLGRNDHQVKIRGFRIELGEIEARLLGHEAVKETVVIAREDAPGDKRLIAYLVPCDPAQPPSAEELRAHLKLALPDYMVPSAFVTLERMPLSPNGKLDRRALPAPQLAAYARRAYEAPQGELEELLADVWQALLQVEKVGRHDNFFELGGHSLMIVQMMDRLRRVGVSAELRTIFDSVSLADLASRLTRSAAAEAEAPPNLIPEDCAAITPRMLPLVELTEEEIARIVDAVPGGARNVQDIYPLAPLQEGILFHHVLNERGGDTYVVPTLLCVATRARLDELIAALQSVIDRHDVLRTAIVWERLPKPVQVVYRRATLPVEEIALDADRDPREQVRAWIAPDRQRMDLRQAPLLRLTVAPDPHSDRWYALLQFHHIVGDNTSQDIVVSEAVALLEGRVTLLPPVRPYREHVAQALAAARAHDAERFFRSKLGDVDEPTAPFGLLDVHGDGAQLEEAHEDIDAHLTQRLRAQARRAGVSAAALCHAAWGLVVAQTSGRDDIVFGSVLLGRMRSHAGAEPALGMFINTLPLRLRLKGRTAGELVEQTQRELAELLDHEQASLAVAQRCSAIGGSAPLFSALLNYRHGAPTHAQWGAATGVEVLASRDLTNYPVTVSIDDLTDTLRIVAQTDRRIEPRRIAQYTRVALEAIVEALEQASTEPVLALSILPQEERRQVVELFNRTQAPYPHDKRIHELFEERVRQAGEAVAVVYQGQSLSYAELNRRANRLARCLRARGVAVGDYVPVLMSRSLTMLVAQLALLKIGAVYVPMDPELPAERCAFMIRDCAARHVLVDGGMPRGLDIDAVHWIDCAALGDKLARQSAENLHLPMETVAPAYVMYTSGSTGTPKGVIVAQHAVNRLAIDNGYARFQPDDCLVHYSNPAFDASTMEVWGALLNGARLLIVPQHVVLDAQQFAALLERERVTVLYMSVGLFNQYTTALAKVFRQLRYLMVGGDSLEPEAIRRVLRTSPPQRLLNAYGPTECTTLATTYTIEALEDDATSIPIGRPIANGQIYILNEERQPVPIGVAGEIYIGGAGVACGYLNRPELTAERFLPDPFSAVPGARMYRTGDLGRWRPDGVIEFLGRNDFQVKIRGFRIELGEIEAQLVRHEDVKSATVLARQDGPGEKRLVAYVVPRNMDAPVSAEDLRTWLKTTLPEYMLPSAFVTLERLPLTASGKVDRRALPAPDLGDYASRAYAAPQGEVEEILAGIWQSLLGVQRVGRHDNFFELGGHSLLIVQLLDRLRRVGLSAQVRTVFDSPTLADLAGALTREVIEHYEVPPNLIPHGCTEITPQMLPLVDLDAEHIARIVQSVPGGAANVQDIYPLAPLQEGILFHHLLDEGAGDAYVLPTVLAVSSRQRMQELIAALQAVIDAHEVLRTAVLWEHLPRPVQVVWRRAVLPTEVIALDAQRDTLEQIQEWIRPQRQRLDIRRAPLMRVQVAPDPHSEQWYVFLQLHHMTIDHVALEIVTSEIAAHLEGRAQPVEDAVPYRSHVAQALAYARTHDAEAFFRAKLADVDEPTAPFGLLDVHGDGAQIEDAYETLEPELAQAVRAQARRLGVSAATLFHAAWGLVVAHTSGRDDVVFGTVLLGRLQGTAGAQRTLGMFINTLPLRLCPRDVTVAQFVEQTQRELVELLGHEQASLAAAQRCSGVIGSTPLFTALLNYRHSVPDTAGEWASASGVRVLANQERTNYPVTLSVDDLGDGFSLKAQVDRRIAAHRVTAYLRTALEALVQALAERPQTPALALSILPERERQQIAAFNATQAPWPRERLVHRLFAQQVERTPQATAVVHERQSLTYAELDDRAERLARYLRRLGVGPDELVGVCVERGVDMIVGLLGILKAGAAYLPLDPNYPRERLAYMLQDAAPRVVLTQESLIEVLPADRSTRLVKLDAVLSELLRADAEPASPMHTEQTSETLVYVIYTSGSTGRPKGTGMPHRAMVNLIEWHRRTLPADEPTRVLQFAALSFDVAFQEIFTTLCTGGTLVMLDEWVRRDAAALMELLHRQRIARLFLPPLMLQTLAEHYAMDGSAPAHLKDVITAGEQLRISPEIVRLFADLEGCRLHNHYGPTETHVVTALTLTGDPQAWPALPAIGMPIANTQIHILDARGQLVPLGVAGELYIAGANVARGYLHRPELTAERFMRDPFSDDPQARMYRTGDLGRWRLDGSIEYLGRNDDQVKIRGHRVELGEIEAQLAQHPQVRDAAVVAREDASGGKRLVGYVTPRGGEPPSVDALSAYLKDLLPDYMVPGAFVLLEALPLTPSGKLDRRALPAPELDAYATRDYQPPEGDVEQCLATIWQEVLGTERVGRDDDFFALGGHSLLAMKALFRVNQALGCALRVTDAYKHPTIRELAARIGAGASADALVDLAQEATLPGDVVPRRGRLRVPARAVLLTGGTGFVGRFLLTQLLQEEPATIYCLVRSDSRQQALSRLRAALAKWDLWRDEFEARIIAIPGDLRRPRLGIDEVTWRLLCRKVDSIYHCATSMNHLETYAMAKAANVDSVREVLAFATQDRPKLVNYVSTLGVFAASALEPLRVVDERTPIDHEKHWKTSGYTASKWVAEKIFMEAARRGIACNIFRLGLVWADTQLGRFDELQHVYRVLKTCLLSGYGIENYHYPMPPTPVDYVARAIVRLARRPRGQPGIFHLSSPTQMEEGVFERCNAIAGTRLELLPYYDWVCAIKRLHRSGQSLPAVPLIEYAFSMDEASFQAHQRSARSAANIRFDCSATQRELARAGIVAPVLNDEMLRVCLQSMLARDPDLQELAEADGAPRAAVWKEGCRPELS